MPFASSVFSIPTSGRASAPAVARPVRGRCRRGWRRSAGSARLRAEGLLAGEADLAALVDLEDFHHHLVALVQHVAHLGDALGRELRDVHETVGAGEDLDEGTEVHDLLDRPFVDLPDLGLGGEAVDPVDGLLHRRLVGRRDVDRPIVLDVDLDAGLLDDAANHLAARSDHVANAVDADLQRHNARCV